VKQTGDEEIVSGSIGVDCVCHGNANAIRETTQNENVTVIDVASLMQNESESVRCAATSTCGPLNHPGQPPPACVQRARPAQDPSATQQSRGFTFTNRIMCLSAQFLCTVKLLRNSSVFGLAFALPTMCETNANDQTNRSKWSPPSDLCDEQECSGSNQASQTTARLQHCGRAQEKEQ